MSRSSISSTHAKQKQGVKLDNELNVESLKTIIAEYKAAIKKYTGKDFPSDPYEQMWNAIGARLRLVDERPGLRLSPAVRHPRRMGHRLQHHGDGLRQPRRRLRHRRRPDPRRLARRPGINGDYLINAQGEDVVNGSRPTKRIEETLGKDMPAAFKELVEVGHKLEKHYRNMQDIEFTISRNKLYMLQTRNAKRTGFAAVRVATDLVEEGLISKEEAISAKFIPAGDLEPAAAAGLRHGGEEGGEQGGQAADQGHPGRPRRRDRQDRLLAAEGRGDEAGQPEDAAHPGPQGDDAGRPARHEGGAGHPDGRRRRVSSHAALVSRQMGKVCIVGAGELDIDNHAGTVTVKGKTLKEGDDISIDGFTGEVFAGSIATKPSEVVQVLDQEEAGPGEVGRVSPASS